MLTPEQTRLRIQGDEMRKLRAENEILKQKIQDMRKSVKNIALLLAEKMPYSARVKIIKMANEIDA